MELARTSDRVGNRVLRILIVEDSAIDYDFLAETLRRQGLAVDTHRVDSAADMARALAESRWDAIISDHHLPGFSSNGALEVLRHSGLDLPFLIVSGTIGEDVAVDAMHRGADDYLVKGRLARLGAALEHAIAACEARRERSRARLELERSERRLQSLSAHLLTHREAERAELARELHDDVGGTLAGVRFDLAWIERRAEPEIAERARHAMASLTEAMQAAQRLMRELRPPVLDAGLVDALEWLVARFRRRSGLQVRFASNVESLELDELRAMVVYRSLQEALTNILKHAQANSVRVDLVVTGEQLSLEISDDGIGFTEAERDKEGSFGLRGLTERARRVGGWLEVTGDGRGCTVLLTLPTREDAA
ncbi:MAG: response regulator [Burkholderiaceae bacterium]